MQIRELIGAAAIAIALSACATGYHASGATGGFIERPLSPDSYVVEFQGNGFTNPQRANDFLLLRCAELALENGYSHFAIIQAEDTSKTSYAVMPTRTTTTSYGDATLWGNSLHLNGTSNTQTSGGEVVPILKPGAGAVIKLLRDPSDQAFDANMIKTTLRAKYKLD